MDSKKNDYTNSLSLILRHIRRILLRMMPFIPAPEIYDLINDLNKSRTSLDEKIDRAYESLQETSSLISELEKGLKDRVNKVERLKAEYEKYSKLAEIEEDKARALIQQLELTIGMGRLKERVVSLLLNLIAAVIVFMLGVIFGPALTKLIGIKV